MTLLLGRRVLSSTLVACALVATPFGDSHHGRPASPSISLTAATGLASRSHHFWVGAGYQRFLEDDGARPGHVRSYTVVYGCVALKKMEGITSVNVTLKRGVAHITLKEGNAVSLTRLRRIVKDAGYTTGDADVTVRGDLARRGDELVLDVLGTGTVLRVAADPTAPDVVERLRQSTGGSGVRVELVGKVPAAPADSRQVDTVQVRSFTIDP